MKLAEALLLRSDMKKKLASLRERIAANAVVQEKEKPQENPAQLMKEAVGILGDLEGLVLQINAANVASKASDGRSLAQLVARRDTLVQQHSLLQVAVQGARKEPERYSMKEIKWVATVDVAKLQKQSDDLSKKIRELNALIQETNWRVEIK
ncbi:MAG: septicolysin [Phycisphaerales bacterium]|jgi:uncharacterized membrane protein|nr:septicolysin [Phycisphaerales bacterium]